MASRISGMTMTALSWLLMSMTADISECMSFQKLRYDTDCGFCGHAAGSITGDCFCRHVGRGSCDVARILRMRVRARMPIQLRETPQVKTPDRQCDRPNMEVKPVEYNQLSSEVIAKAGKHARTSPPPPKPRQRTSPPI